jgi:hypothetical protein
MACERRSGCRATTSYGRPDGETHTSRHGRPFSEGRASERSQRLRRWLRLLVRARRPPHNGSEAGVAQRGTSRRCSAADGDRGGKPTETASRPLWHKAWVEASERLTSDRSQSDIGGYAGRARPAKLRRCSSTACRSSGPCGTAVRLQVGAASALTRIPYAGSGIPKPLPCLTARFRRQSEEETMYTIAAERHDESEGGLVARDPQPSRIPPNAEERGVVDSRCRMPSARL